MMIRLGLMSVLIAFSSSALSAATCEEYVRACVNNKNNGMEEQQCICVWNAALHFTDDQRAFLIATAAKDSGKTQALMVKLGQQVAPVMMFAMTQPTNCPPQKKKTASEDSPAAASATSTGAAADAAVKEEAAAE